MVMRAYCKHKVAIAVVANLRTSALVSHGQTHFCAVHYRLEMPVPRNAHWLDLYKGLSWLSNCIRARQQRSTTLKSSPIDCICVYSILRTTYVKWLSQPVSSIDYLTSCIMHSLLVQNANAIDCTNGLFWILTIETYRSEHLEIHL